MEKKDKALWDRTGTSMDVYFANGENVRGGKIKQH